ncbi:hypothetical protein KY342_00495 [Candidatus Woesearchaeota archaeon]|nr:hypothetical protein [Candidatus Woesearchaeota archaeon]
MTNPKLKQIIEYLAGLYMNKLEITGKKMLWEDFHRAMLGIYGKEPYRMPKSEFEEHKKELEKIGIVESSTESEKFLEIDNDLPLGMNIRFYINAHDARSAREICKATVNGLKKQRFKIKTSGRATFPYDRFDNTVLYINKNDDVKSVIEFYQELTKSNETLFDNEVPLITQKFAKGIGIAVSPEYEKREILGNYFGYFKFTFNGLHSTVLNILFDEYRKRGISDLNQMTDLYSQALKQAGFNPEKPYLNLGMEDPLDLIGK